MGLSCPSFLTGKAAPKKTIKSGTNKSTPVLSVHGWEYEEEEEEEEDSKDELAMQRHKHKHNHRNKHKHNNQQDLDIVSEPDTSEETEHRHRKQKHKHRDQVQESRDDDVYDFTDLREVGGDDASVSSLDLVDQYDIAKKTKHTNGQETYIERSDSESEDQEDPAYENLLSKMRGVEERLDEYEEAVDRVLAPVVTVSQQPPRSRSPSLNWDYNLEPAQAWQDPTSPRLSANPEDVVPGTEESEDEDEYRHIGMAPIVVEQTTVVCDQESNCVVQKEVVEIRESHVIKIPERFYASPSEIAQRYRARQQSIW